MDKINFLLIGTFIVSLGLLVLIVSIIPEAQTIKEFNINDPYVNQPIVEKVELYYNLDDPSKVYELPKGGTFKEVMIDG